MAPRLEKISSLRLYQQLIILAMVVLLVVLGFVFMVYQPMSQNLDDLNSDYSKLQSKLQESRRIAKDLPKFKSEFEKLQKQLNDALAELPNKKEIPSLLTSISGLAKEDGLEVLSFQPKGQVKKGFYAEVPVELELRGSYHEVAMFFYDVGKLARIVNINNLQMGNAKMVAGRNVLSIKCLATTFMFVESAPDKSSNKKRKGKRR